MARIQTESTWQNVGGLICPALAFCNKFPIGSTDQRWSHVSIIGHSTAASRTLAKRARIPMIR